MLSTIHTHTKSLLARAIALVALAAVAVSMAAAGPASAQPKGTGGGSKGCPVEDENGNVTYVPVGTTIGLFHCGSDGDWHFGWLVNARAASPSKLSPIHISAKEKRLARTAALARRSRPTDAAPFAPRVPSGAALPRGKLSHRE